MDSQLEIKIKKALRRFRKLLTIPNSELKLDAEVFAYLYHNKLIDESTVWEDGCRIPCYSIVPRGFNWNVDYGAVEMPGTEEHDPDIMDRDAEVDLM